MYIYLDESYNLKDRNKKQFISINGFAVLNERDLFKRWKEYRRPFVGRRRIHAKDSAFNKLRLKTLKLFARHDLTLLTVFQIVQEIPFRKEKGYYDKNKLQFDKVYLDLLKALFRELNLNEYREVKIIVDSRKHKGGLLAKNKFIKEIKNFLKQKFAETKIEFKLQPSTTDILIEFADFVSNIFYRAYIKEDTKFFENLKFKIVQIKNPLV